MATAFPFLNHVAIQNCSCTTDKVPFTLFVSDCVLSFCCVNAESVHMGDFLCIKVSDVTKTPDCLILKSYLFNYVKHGTKSPLSIMHCGLFFIKKPI